MTDQEHDETKEDTLLLQQALIDTLRSNRGGIECLQTNNTARAVKLFSIAFSKHERVKSKLFADIVRRRTTTRTRKRNGNTIGAGMGDWFVRDQLPTPLWNGEENSTDDLLYREPIRMPLEIETVVSSIVLTCYDTKQELCEESVSNAMDLLTTCHAYNLGLVNHLFGLELLHSGDCGVSSRADDPASNYHVNTNNNNTSGSVSEDSTATPSPNPNANFYLNRAGRFYEFTLRTERSRSKDENNRRQNINTETKIPRLVVVLGCLNNLADLYQKGNQAVRCKHCFKQLKTTTERLQGLLLPGQQPLSQEDERLLRSYLPVFLNRSHEGLLRLRRRTTGSDDETSSDGDSVDSPSSRASSPTQQPHYAFNSFSAGAA